MSFDATRAAWAARRAGGLDGGPALLVALAMADQTYQDTGEAVTGTRGLAALCGMSHTTVTAALRDLQSAGVIECAERGQGSRASRWRWVLAQRYSNGTQTGSAQGVDKSPQRASTVTLADGESNAKPDLRATSVTLACQMSNNYQDQVYPRVNDDDLAEHLREGVDPEKVPERVAALRDALGGHRGGRRPPSHNGVAPPVPDALLQRPDIGAEYGDPEDGWQP